MFCSKCGAKIEDDSIFCCKCGAKIASTSLDTNTVNNENRINTNDHKVVNEHQADISNNSLPQASNPTNTMCKPMNEVFISYMRKRA